ncbi:DUF4199 domain-containing protein [Bergeyella zoohelcum]|nr:DUF4199 domain-containing protein [Bergeyella zoohelcum]MDY6024920.1 DUF4199 domain-containing protein [Bergeyella zoohelcum]
MTKNLFIKGIYIALVIIVLFFIAYFFLKDDGYYKTSILLNAFAVPLILGLGAFLSVRQLTRNGGFLTFKMIYKQAFVPIFVGGTLSLFFIFAFLNYGDQATKALLNQQYIESYKNALEDEYASAKKIVKPNSDEDKELEEKYAQAKVRIADKVSKNEDMFSAQYFMYIYAGYCAFFLILSLFFASFFRSR